MKLRLLDLAWTIGTGALYYGTVAVTWPLFL